MVIETHLLDDSNDNIDESLYNLALKTTLGKHKLPNNYLQTVKNYLEPISNEIGSFIESNTKRTTLVLGVQGTQGSGKSTCSDFLKCILESRHHKNVVVLSIDDFYLSHADRQKLAADVHPLLATRGVPGTHDVNLAIDIIERLKNLKDDTSLSVPRFNKALDDRFAEKDWSQITGPIDCVILEGWCVGLSAQEENTLVTPINELESSEDTHGLWRQHANKKLATEYVKLFSLLDKQIVLQAPSFACVYDWRLKQEQKLQDSLTSSPNKVTPPDNTRVMGDKDIARFISHYERLTNHALDSMPKQADWCLWLNKDQSIERMTPSNGYHTMGTHYMVVTDLDGTLLDHHSYSWEAANESIEMLRQRNIPIVINTSKTAEEVESLQRGLSISDPFIVENGSALYLPKDYLESLNITLPQVFELSHQHNISAVENNRYLIVIFGKTYKNILKTMNVLKNDYGFKYEGYNDWNTHKIVEKTGLTIEEARLSKKRAYSEPVIWTDNDENLKKFIRLLEKGQLTTLQGGRFLHILGKTNKAKPMTFLKKLFESAFKKEVTSIALGDSANDSAMLAEANFAVWIKKSKGIKQECVNKKSYYTDGVGPIGWHEAIVKLIH